MRAGPSTAPRSPARPTSSRGLILNDFEAQALALPTVRSEWVRQIGDVHNTLGGAQVVLGPGTGLGASALIEVEGRHFALASEAGHVDFGPVGAEEGAIWPHISMAPHGRISAETVFSGPPACFACTRRASPRAGRWRRTTT